MSSSASAQLESSRPTPAEWRQWQPEQGSSDARLQQRSVTVWGEEIALSDFLGRIGEACGVALTAEAELRDTRLTVFARDCTPAGLMVSLAGLLDGYWLYPREQVDEARAYRLVPASRPDDAPSKWVALRLEARQALLQKDQSALEARLDIYAEALKLGPEELLERYEESDPWLCADVLDPSLRPLLEKVCTLSEEDKEELLSTGNYARPLRSLDPAFRAELGRQVTDHRAYRYSTSQPGPYPDRLVRFPSPEECWDNTVVWFRSNEYGFHVTLNMPDVGSFTKPIVRLPRTPPASARKQLARLGYREDTPDYRDAARAEQERWLESNPASMAEPRGEEQLMAEALAGELNLEEPRLNQEMDLGALARRDSSVPAVLEEVSRQCDLAVLAHCLPPEKARIRLPETAGAEGGRATLGELLAALRTSDPAWAWRFYGRYLVVRHTDYASIEAQRIPEDLLAELLAGLRPGASLSLEEAAALLARLSFVQVCALQEQVDPSWSTPIWHWRQYGLVVAAAGEGQRSALTSDHGLPLTALGSELQEEFLSVARATRPWVTQSDLSATTVRIMPRRLVRGEEGISLILDYHFPDSPRDRDIFFTSPFQVTVQGY